MPFSHTSYCWAASVRPLLFAGEIGMLVPRSGMLKSHLNVLSCEGMSDTSIFLLSTGSGLQHFLCFLPGLLFLLVFGHPY